MENENNEIIGKKKTYRSDEQKKALLHRLKRIEGQIRGLEKMVEEDIYCNDILQQSISAGSAIDGFNQELIGYHIKGCVTNGIKSGDEEIIDELLKTLRKLMK
ncbi:MAG: metal-sensing transcriptional repressor [Lachnospiraceae bacterium]|nr:metal-sensing transcriptional repressor [Lachnospiraceae bacterium]